MSTAPLFAQGRLPQVAGIQNATRSPAATTLASAIVPGAGQLLMHQRRAYLYLALEAVGVGFYVSEMRDGARERTRYREISRDVARAQFSPNGPQGTWDYYERMEKYVASGAFDVVPGGDIDPETAADTYNGAMWLLARQTFWRDPASPPASTSAEYRSAIDFYASRAVTSEFRWSWIGAPADLQHYRTAIASSNSAYRNATQTASLILANHFLSAVDAYTSVRARVHAGSDGSRSIGFAISF